MSRTTVLKQALQLPLRARAEVAAELLDSLEGASEQTTEEVEKAWAQEIERRARRVLTGESKGRPWEEVRAKVSARLSSR